MHCKSTEGGGEEEEQKSILSPLKIVFLVHINALLTATAIAANEGTTRKNDRGDKQQVKYFYLPHDRECSCTIIFSWFVTNVNEAKGSAFKQQKDAMKKGR